MEFTDLRPIEPITRDHRRQDFDSAVSNLDNYLRDRAVSDSERNLSRVFVLTLRAAPSTVVGYYSLASLAVPAEGMPSKLIKKLAYKSIGTTLLGKLAVDKRWQRNNCNLRLGEHLLLHAMLSSWKAAQSVASWALVVDILVGEQGDPTEFYLRKGFIPFQDSKARLFLPMHTIESTLRAAQLIE